MDLKTVVSGGKRDNPPKIGLIGSFMLTNIHFRKCLVQPQRKYPYTWTSLKPMRQNMSMYFQFRNVEA